MLHTVSWEQEAEGNKKTSASQSRGFSKSLTEAGKSIQVMRNSMCKNTEPREDFCWERNKFVSLAQEGEGLGAPWGTRPERLARARLWKE